MRIIFTFFAFFSATIFLLAQTGCPGCVLNIPANLPADTIFLPPLPDGQQGTPYNEDISFRMPKTTTPVAAVDSTTPPGLTISKIEILSVEGLPSGLSWEASQMVFVTATQTDGCIKICGTPIQSDSFTVLVTLRATVLFITQVTSFPMRLYIAPSSSNTVGFSMTGDIGCGSTTVAFTNNLPSGGNSGYTYTWDFGDSTNYLGENPAAHTYATPGNYAVAYTANIDTTGFILQQVKILDVDCVDQLGLGAPDLFVKIKDPAGNEIFNSAVVDNATLPLIVNIGIVLGAGTYTLETWDDDSGLKGGDDPCGTVSFNLLSNDTLVATGFSAVFNIIHPVTTVTSTDTVTVYPQPAVPAVVAANGTSICTGLGILTLESNYSLGNQWFLDGELLSGATDSTFFAAVNGSYTVRYTAPDGCTATSVPVVLTYLAPPDAPVFINNNNRLQVADTSILPADYALQWYLDGVAITGETDIRYCTMASGFYTLQLTDLATGCTSEYALGTTLNPNFDCTIGTNDLAAFGAGFSVFPNPASDKITLSFDTPLAAATTLRISDIQGRMRYQQLLASGSTVVEIACADWPVGVFVLEWSSGGRVLHEKVVVGR